MKGLCGANCAECISLKENKCKGCKNSNSCPFGKKCWIANYIEIGGTFIYVPIRHWDLFYLTLLKLI